MVMPVRLSHLKSDLVECDTHGGGYLARWCSLTQCIEFVVLALCRPVVLKLLSSAETGVKHYKAARLTRCQPLILNFSKINGIILIETSLN